MPRLVVLSHSHQWFREFFHPPKDFYASVEKKLLERKVTGLSAERVTWKEGGLLSAKREYLRLLRGRTLIDICAAPFGTGYFVSLWVAEVRLAVTIADILVALFIGGALGFVAIVFLGKLYGTVAIICAPLAAFLMMRAGAGMRLYDLDAALMNLGIVGPVYDRFFRVETYYRIDTDEALVRAV